MYFCNVLIYCVLLIRGLWSVNILISKKTNFCVLILFVSLRLTTYFLYVLFIDFYDSDLYVYC